MEIGLEEGSVVGIDGQKGGLALRCLEGCLYVTRTGDPRDYFLAPGEQMELKPRESVVVEAWGASRMVCLMMEVRQPRHGRVETWHLVGSA